MTNNTDGRETSNADRVEFHLAKAEHFRSKVWPYFESSYQLLSHAVLYGKSALAQLVILNGGGLVALPAFVGLFKLETEAPLESWVYIASTYIAGIAFALTATFVAYLNFSVLTGITYSTFELMREYADFEMPDPDISEESIAETLANIEKIKKTRNQRERWLPPTVWLPLIFGIASFGCFVYGGYRMMDAFIRLT